MKLAALVPIPRTAAIHALLSFASDRWQSVHCLVSVMRTVCGGFGVKANPEYPAAEIVGCWVTTWLRPRSCTVTTTAEAERIGEYLLPFDAPLRPSRKASLRSICGL